MGSEKMTDPGTGREFYLDSPDELGPDEEVTFLLNLHGGGSFGAWQRLYFPAFELADAHRLVVATPTAATSEPVRRWVEEADDQHLQNVVDLVFDRFGPERVRSFWLVGHSQGGMTSNRLLATDYFASRVDGWLSLSGGRIGRAELAAGFGPPQRPGTEPFRFPAGDGQRPRPGVAVTPEADLSFIFATGEHEIAALPETSPWAEKYGAGPRVRLADVIDEKPGQVYDTSREGNSSPSWGLSPRPGTAQVFVYPNATGGWVIADVVRLDKGHTEGLEPRVTEELVKMIVGAPGGKAGAKLDRA